MSQHMIIIIVVAVAVIFWAYNIYDSVIRKKNKVLEAFNQISVQLKKEYDLIPNILEIVNKCVEQEKNLIDEVTALRTKAISLPNNLDNLEEKLSLNAEIKSKMRQIAVAVENNPQLKTDKAMIALLQSYNKVDEYIAAAKILYNSAVFELNNAVERFPSSVVAGRLNIKKHEFFQVYEV